MEFDATFLISIISFVVFVFIMNAVLYKPVLRIIEQRNNIVESNFNEAKELKMQTQKQEQYHDSELENSRSEARTSLDKEMKLLKNQKVSTISDYKKELLENVAQEKENLRNSALSAKETLKDDVVDIAKNISNLLLGDMIDSESINKSKIKIKEEQV